METGFGTPTGKVEFVSTILEGSGHDGLPIYREPYWSPFSVPELAPSYPLVITTGARTRTYTHSQGRELEILRNQEPEPFLEIHRQAAAERGIEEGDPVRISSPLGEITMRAAVTDSLAPGVVSAPHGWAEADVNRLIPDGGLDPISGFPPFKSSLCQVELLAGPRAGPRGWAPAAAPVLLILQRHDGRLAGVQLPSCFRRDEDPCLRRAGPVHLPVSEIPASVR